MRNNKSTVLNDILNVEKNDFSAFTEIEKSFNKKGTNKNVFKKDEVLLNGDNVLNHGEKNKSTVFSECGIAFKNTSKKEEVFKLKEVLPNGSNVVNNCVDKIVFKNDSDILNKDCANDPRGENSEKRKRKAHRDENITSSRDRDQADCRKHSKKTNKRVDTNGLTCLYTNSDSLLNKRFELEVEIDIHKPDIIAICEIKPKKCRYQVQPGEIAIQGFELFHNLESPGRGVAVLVRSNLNPSVCDDLSSDFQESIFVDCKTSNNEILTVGIVYRSPSSTSDNSRKLNTLIRKTADYRNKNILIVGDFNYPEIVWETESTRTQPDHNAAVFLDSCKDSYLIQHQIENTRYRQGQKPSLIDLVLTNKEELIDNITTCAGLGKSDHCTLIVKLACTGGKKQHIPRPLFNKADFEKINNDLSEIDWCNDLENLDVEDAWLKFKNCIDYVINKHVPKSKPSSKPKSKKWMTPELLEIVKKKSIAHSDVPKLVKTTKILKKRTKQEINHRENVKRQEKI